MKFHCPHCTQRLEVDDHLAGRSFDCPACKQSLRVPAAAPPAVHRPVPARPAAPTPKIAKPARAGLGLGKFLLLIVALALGAFSYAAYRFQESPRQTWDRLVDFAESRIRSSPARAEAPATAEATVAPEPAEPGPPEEPSPAPTPDALAWLIEDRERWPAEVTLQQAAHFPVVSQGRVAGSAVIPAGTVVKLVKIGRGEVTVEHRGGTRRLGIAATDLPARAAVAYAKAGSEPAEPQTASVPETPVPSKAGADLVRKQGNKWARGFGLQQKVRVMTWNLKWFPNGMPDEAPLAAQNKYIAAAAGVVRTIDPDILLLQEIKDLDACTRLAEAIKPGAYKVAVCSTFREADEVSKQQLAILAKGEAEAAWAEEWKTLDGVDPPRGFAFAWFSIGGADIGVYSLHLKSNRGEERELKANIGKRESSARQLVSHLHDVIPTKIPRIGAVVVGGDFNTNPDDPRFADEGTMKTLLENGFRNCLEALAPAAKKTMPKSERYPATTFDYLFVKGATFQKPQVLRSSVSDHYPVICDFMVPAGGSGSRPVR